MTCITLAFDLPDITVFIPYSQRTVHFFAYMLRGFWINGLLHNDDLLHVWVPITPTGQIFLIKSESNIEKWL